MKGVAAYIEREDENKLRLVFDDIEAISNTKNPDWKHSVVFTSNTYAEDKLTELALSKEQFAEIGENIVIRLLALGGLIK